MRFGEAASHSIQLVAMMPFQLVSDRRAQSSTGCRGGEGNAAVLTMWKKSLLFNCSGFPGGRWRWSKREKREKG